MRHVYIRVHTQYALAHTNIIYSIYRLCINKCIHIYYAVNGGNVFRVRGTFFFLYYDKEAYYNNSAYKSYVITKTVATGHCGSDLSRKNNNI